MTKQLILMTALIAASIVGACSNTVHGAGEDIENAGEHVQTAVPPKH